MAKATTTTTRPITIPNLTLEQARVLLCWWEQSQKNKAEGRGNDDDLIDWRQMMDTVQFRFGFAAWDAASTLREMPEALLGRWGLPQGMSELHHLHPYLRLNPTLIYEALNRAETEAGMKPTRNPFTEVEEEPPAPNVTAPKPVVQRTAVTRAPAVAAKQTRTIRAPKGKAKSGLARAAQAAKATSTASKSKGSPKHEA